MNKQVENIQKNMQTVFEGYVNGQKFTSREEMNQFINAIENDTDTPLGVVDGLKPVLMGLAAKKSVEEHRPVAISEITM